MKAILLPENHLSISCEKDIRAICTPLLENCFINYFDYHRHYNDGTMFTISTHGLLLKEYINQHLFPSFEEIDSYVNKYAYISCGLTLPLNDKRFVTNLGIATELGIPHRLYFIKKFKDYYELCGFGTNLISSNLTEFFTNNLDIFEKFIIYFRSAAYDIIQKAYATRIILPINTNDISQINLDKTIINKKLFLDKILQKKYPILDENDHMIFISKREMECILGICLGKSAKIMANEMLLSIRTVETYMASLKSKLGCVSKYKLIQCARKNKLI